VVESEGSPTETAVWELVANVAVSVEPSGTVFGVQLVAVYQSLFVGLRFHLALPALLVYRANIKTGAG